MKARSALREWLEYLPLRLLFGLVRVLPEGAARKLAAALGSLWHALDPRRRRVARENLALAEGLPPGLDRDALVREVFRNLTRLAFEFIRLGDRVARGAVEIAVEGWEHVDAARAQGRGVLLLSAHLGNWELVGAAATARNTELWGVARAVRNARVNRLLLEARARAGMRVIPSRRAVPGILRVLRRGGAVAILLDHNSPRRESVFVPFFGRTAAVNTGLALIARRTGAPVVPVFALRTGPGSHVCRVQPALDLVKTEDAEHDILENTRRMTRVIEEAVRAAPAQWLWIHRRWKTRPPGEDAPPPAQ